MEQLLDARVITLEANYTGIREDIAEIKGDVKDVRATLVGRPSWWIAGLLSVLSSTTVGLAVALLSTR